MRAGRVLKDRLRVGPGGNGSDTTGNKIITWNWTLKLIQRLGAIQDQRSRATVRLGIGADDFIVHCRRPRPH